jgi:hypothetical protein
MQASYDTSVRVPLTVTENGSCCCERPWKIGEAARSILGLAWIMEAMYCDFTSLFLLLLS